MISLKATEGWCIDGTAEISISVLTPAAETTAGDGWPSTLANFGIATFRSGLSAVPLVTSVVGIRTCIFV